MRLGHIGSRSHQGIPLPVRQILLEILHRVHEMGYAAEQSANLGQRRLIAGPPASTAVWPNAVAVSVGSVTSSSGVPITAAASTSPGGPPP